MSDINRDAPGLVLARRNDIEIHFDPAAAKILEDPDIDMIFEVTGSEELFSYLQDKKQPNCNIMCASMAKIIFFLLNSQQEVSRELREYKLKLTERVIARTDELEEVNLQLKEQINLQQTLNNKLQEINNEKTKYLLNATHQLKAPFAAIQSYIEILIEGYTDVFSEKVIQVLQRIRSRCILLSTLIRQMLELANLNSVVEENIKKENYSLIKIITKVINSETAILEKRNIIIKVSDKTEKDLIFCNVEQIEILIQILVDNAINYSFDNSEIEIIVDNDSNHRLVLIVRDNGLGIEEENLTGIFKEYFRTYNAAKHYNNGSGSRIGHC